MVGLWAVGRRGVRSFWLLAGGLAAFPAVVRAATHEIYDPAQIRSAYGFNGVDFGDVAATGAGQTIAIVDAYSDADITSDLASFDSHFGIAAPPSFTIENQTGGNTLPPPDPGTTGSNWNLETSIDVEWAHAIAPGANILLVQTNSNSYANFYTGVRTAAATSGVSVVSMSWGSSQYSGETANDPSLVTPVGHQGVTFVACSGDSAYLWHPAVSPTVLGVGGTSLTLSQNIKYASESVWNDSYGSGGAGVSTLEKEPAYQEAVQQTGYRQGPDVAYDAAEISDYDTYVDGTLENCYGTSCGAPQWAALIALADQGREMNGLGTLDSSNLTTGTMPLLYDLYDTPFYDEAFHDITTGENTNGVAAGPGFDNATGLGTPQANFLIPYLAGDIAIPEPAALMLGVAGAALLRRRSRRV